MKISKNIKKAKKRNRNKKLFSKIVTCILAYTIFLPYTIYYKNKGKIHGKQYRRIVSNKEKYKDKVLKEILTYMTRKDIPKAFTQKYRSEECSEKECLIYKDERRDWGDIFGDFHLKDFISIWSYGKNTIRRR